MDTNPNARDMHRLKRVQVSQRVSLPKTPVFSYEWGAAEVNGPFCLQFKSLFLPAYMSAYSPVVLHDAVHTTCDKRISPIPSAHSRPSPPPLGCLTTTASANSPLNCCSRVQAPVGNPHARNQWLYLNSPQPHSHKTSVVKACHSTTCRENRSCPTAHPSPATTSTSALFCYFPRKILSLPCEILSLYPMVHVPYIAYSKVVS
jgi:hypothetical protein